MLPLGGSADSYDPSPSECPATHTPAEMDRPACDVGSNAPKSCLGFRVRVLAVWGFVTGVEGSGFMFGLWCFEILLRFWGLRGLGVGFRD